MSYLFRMAIYSMASKLPEATRFSQLSTAITGFPRISHSLHMLNSIKQIWRSTMIYLWKMLVFQCLFPVVPFFTLYFRYLYFLGLDLDLQARPRFVCIGLYRYVCIYSCKGAIGKLLGDYQHGLESTNEHLWNCLKHSHEQPNIPSTSCQSYGISNASNVNSIKFTIITLAQFLHWSSMLKLTSKVVMWGSTKICMCFCCPFFVRKTLPWTNHGQTVERPRIVVDTAPPKKITETVRWKCFTSINALFEMTSELHVRAGNNTWWHKFNII